ncbi:MAG: tetratricopeptide repeat protein [Verrucomicrobiota bacterium]
MADPTPQDPSPIAEISHGPSAFETFLDQNQKKLILLGVLIALGMGAWVVKEGMQDGAYLAAGNDLTAASDLASLEEVVKNHANTPSAASASVLLSDAQWEQGQQDASIATLEAEIAANPEHPATAPARARLAARLHEQGKTEEAKAAYQAILDQPTAAYFGPYALISLGHIAKAEGDLEKAETLYTQAREGYPDNRLASEAAKAEQFANFKMPEEIDPPEPPAEEAAAEGAGVDQTPFDPTALQGNQPNPLFPNGGLEVPAGGELPTPPPIAPPAPVSPPADPGTEAPEAETPADPAAEAPSEDESNE